jgi:hypothetical protein
MAYYVDFHLATVHAGSEMTSAGILDTMLVAPLDVISHVASWKAFSLVSLAGLLSMVFAYRSDDPYPGYGEVQRSYYRVRNAGLQVSSDFEKRINAMIDEGDAHTLQIAKRIKAGIRKYARLADKSQQMASSLDDYDEALEETCNLVLDRYRHINSSVRRSEPPVSFSEHVCYNPADDSELRRRADSGNRVAELQGRIAELEKEVGIARQGLRALNVRMASSIGDMTAAEASD